MPATKEETRERVSQTVRLVNELEQMAAIQPGAALRRAETVEDRQMRISGLITVGRVTRSVEILADARDAIVGSKMADRTKIDRLARVAFDAVGIDNGFAAEIPDDMPGIVPKKQLQQQLSVAMVGSIRQAINGENSDDLNRYSDLVMGAFHEGVGDSDYFGSDRGQAQHVEAPGRLRGGPPLDPIIDGGRALYAFRENPHYFAELMEFIAQQSGHEVVIITGPGTNSAQQTN
jgi:hypothetical protein